MRHYPRPYLVILRIVIWAFVGFIVSAGWWFYFVYADKARPIGSITNALIYVTQPVVGITTSVFDFPRGVRAVAAENAATYAAIGLVLVIIRGRHARSLRPSD